MKIAIYGAGDYGKYIYNEIISNKHAKVTVIFWIDNYIQKKEVQDLPVYTEKDFLLSSMSSEIDAVVVAMTRELIAQDVIVSLLHQGYERIFWAIPKGLIPRIPVLNTEGNFSSCVKFYKETKPTARLMLNLVVDKCNLNCKRCFHLSNLSNLSEREEFLDLDQFVSHLKQLKKKFKNVLRIQLLGGEPLLNPQLEKYILQTREHFPASRIEIVTNGLLLLQMPSKLIDTIIQCNAVVWISYYPPLKEKIDQIIDFLEKRQINYDITELKTQFRKWISFKEKDGKKAFEKWRKFDCRCQTIEDGKVYLCPCIPKLYAMREYFDIQMEEEDLVKSSIDLMSDENDGWDLLEFFSHPSSICRFCVSEEVWEKWETGQPMKTDWFAD